MSGDSGSGDATFVRRSVLAAEPGAVAAWHRRPGALQRLVPPWTGARVVGGGGAAEPGERVELRVPVGPFPFRWVAEVRPLEDGSGFRDVQLTGPFRRWIHEHRFIRASPPPAGATSPAAGGDGGAEPGPWCAVEDRIRYELPLGAVGRALGERPVRSQLERAFAYRHRILEGDLSAHRRYPPSGETDGAPGRGAGSAHVAVSGSTGLVGSALVAYLRAGGHRVSRLVRREPAGADEITWIPGEGLPRPGALEEVDAVVHLAGESVQGLWTSSRRRRIRESRVPATRRLCRDLAALPSPPPVFVSVSGVNYYGDRGDERLLEGSGSGEGFLAEVCRGWEEATSPLEEAGSRVARLRFGMVLTPAGGALAAMLPAFRAGLGGPLGGGDQFVAWIGMDDLLDVILHCLAEPSLAGAVNAVAPRPVRNREFASTLARVLGRPAALRVPAPVLRAAGGQMAREMLLASLRVEPGELRRAGHRYRHPELEGALRHLLGR